LKVLVVNKPKLRIKRKQTTCDYCGAPIFKGFKAWSGVATYSGKLKTTNMHMACEQHQKLFGIKDDNGVLVCPQSKERSKPYDQDKIVGELPSW